MEAVGHNGSWGPIEMTKCLGRITELFRVEKNLKVLWSNHKSNAATFTSKPWHEESHFNFFGTACCWPFPLGFWGLHSASYLCLPAQGSGYPKVTHLMWCKCSWHSSRGHSGCTGFFCASSGAGVWKCVKLQRLCRAAFLFCASPHPTCFGRQKFLRNCQRPSWWCPPFPQRCSEEMLWICSFFHTDSTSLILRWSNFCQ